MPYTLERRDAIALLRMASGPANTLSLESMDALRAALRELRDDDSVRAVVWAGNERFFSAGLDLKQVADADADGVQSVLASLETLTLDAFQFPKPLVAALTGHAVAGGFILALTADLRIAQRGKAKVGLNELDLGLPLPALVLDLLAHYVPRAQAWRVAREAKLMGVDEAHRLGLVEELSDGALESAMEYATFLASKEPTAFRETKDWARRPSADAMSHSRSWSREAFSDAIEGPASAHIAAAVAKLSKRRA